jgi:hypothetical protein
MTTTPATSEIATTVPANGAAQADEKKQPSRLPYETSDGGAINSFASESNFIVANRMAVALAASTIVPKDYVGNIPNCLIAMELANRIGISVLAVMQNVDIIHGKPGWSSKFLIAMVNSSTDFTKLRFRWVGDRGTDSWGCYAIAKDKETGEECEGPVVDIAMAKAEGWYTRNGSKWKTMPQLMLMYRSAAFWSRVYSPEKTLGMGTQEELEDMGPTGTIDTHVVSSGPAPLPVAAEMGRRISLRQQPLNTAPAAEQAAEAKPSSSEEAKTAPAAPIATPTPAAKPVDPADSISKGPGPSAKPGQQTIPTGAKAAPAESDEDRTNREAAAPRADEKIRTVGADDDDDLMPGWTGGPKK